MRLREEGSALASGRWMADDRNKSEAGDCYWGAAFRAFAEGVNVETCDGLATSASSAVIVAVGGLSFCATPNKLFGQSISFSLRVGVQLLRDLLILAAMMHVCRPSRPLTNGGTLNGCSDRLCAADRSLLCRDKPCHAMVPGLVRSPVQPA